MVRRIQWLRLRVRHPIRYLLGALALGPAYAWILVTAARFLPWTRPIALDLFTRDPWVHAIPFSLACAGLAWGLRRSIAQASGASTAGHALRCSLLGGPVYMVLLLIQSLVLVPEQLHNDAAGPPGLLVLPLACVLLGGLFGALFLPVTLPLTWGAILFLRLLSGGLRPETPAT